MAICYVLFSEKLGKFYIGASQDEIEVRLEKHNSNTYGTHRFTAKADDWALYYSFKADNYAHSIRIERFLKAKKSSKYLRWLKESPSEIEKVIKITQTK